MTSSSENKKITHSKIKEDYKDIFELTYMNKIAKERHNKKKNYKKFKKYPPNETNDSI